MVTMTTLPDLADVKQRQQKTWAAGDYAAVGTILQIVSELLCEAVDLRAGERVLDVATGSGNTALAAARRFGEADDIASLAATRRSFNFRFRSPEHWLEYFRANYGPTLKTFEALDPAGQAALADELLDVLRRFNRSGDATLVAPNDYLEVVAVRR